MVRRIAGLAGGPAVTGAAAAVDRFGGMFQASLYAARLKPEWRTSRESRLQYFLLVEPSRETRARATSSGALPARPEFQSPLLAPMDSPCQVNEGTDEKQI